MSATITIRRTNGIVIIDVAGRVTLNEGGDSLRATMLNLLAEGHSKILLNLSLVTFMDSSGIGELVSGYVCIRHVRGSVKVSGVTKRIQDLLEMTGLHRILDIYDTEEDALRSFT